MWVVAVRWEVRGYVRCCCSCMKTWFILLIEIAPGILEGDICELRVLYALCYSLLYVIPVFMGYPARSAVEVPQPHCSRRSSER